MNKFFSNNKTGMTLVEILVATIILGIVLLAAGTIYVSGVKELARSMDEVKVQREASFALDHIFLNIISAQSLVTNTFPSNSIVVTVDATNKKIKYSLSGTNLIYDPPYATPNPVPANSEIIATGITALRFDRELTVKADGTGTGAGGALLPSDYIQNFVTVYVTAQGDRMQESYSTGVTLRGMSG